MTKQIEKGNRSLITFNELINKRGKKNQFSALIE